MKKIYYSWQDVQGQTLEVIRQISRDGWIPDYVVGLTRGGLVPANLISQYLEVPMECLKVSLRDSGQTEHNCWMAEDAYNGKNILIVDDINDSGATLNWIMKDWNESCHSNPNINWDYIWNSSVRFAVLVNNEASEFKTIDYYSDGIDKSKDPSWIVFPWEDWWKK